MGIKILQCFKTPKEFNWNKWGITCSPFSMFWLIQFSYFRDFLPYAVKHYTTNWLSFDLFLIVLYTYNHKCRDLDIGDWNHRVVAGEKRKENWGGIRLLVKVMIWNRCLVGVRWRRCYHDNWLFHWFNGQLPWWQNLCVSVTWIPREKMLVQRTLAHW